MTRRVTIAAFAAALALFACSGPEARVGAPSKVESLRKKMLSRDQYQALFEEWRAYASAHPDDAVAWAQLCSPMATTTPFHKGALTAELQRRPGVVIDGATLPFSVALAQDTRIVPGRPARDARDSASVRSQRDTL
jgi:hypothetical protein